MGYTMIGFWRAVIEEALGSLTLKMRVLQLLGIVLTAGIMEANVCQFKKT